MNLYEDKTKLQGIITNVQRYTLHDGPGLRTLVFLKGCPLKCLWCSNPETQGLLPELFYFARLCIGCGECIKVCRENAIKIKDDKIEVDWDLCTNCGECIKVCPSGSLGVFGEKRELGSVLEELEKDRLFYEESQGGITLSGGEPLLQSDFSKKILMESKKKYFHTALETCGFAEWDKFEKLLIFTDLIIYDLKCIDSQLHKKLTGSSNELILSNLKKLIDVYKGELLIRIPIIPSCNDSDENLSLIGKYLININYHGEIHLLPYHKLGIKKYEMLGKTYELIGLQPPTTEEMQKKADLLRSYGFYVSLEKT